MSNNSLNTSIAAQLQNMVTRTNKNLRTGILHTDHNTSVLSGYQNTSYHPVPQSSSLPRKPTLPTPSTGVVTAALARHPTSGASSPASQRKNETLQFSTIIDSARKNDTQVHLYRCANEFVEGLHTRSRSNLQTLQPLGQLNTI